MEGNNVMKAKRRNNIICMIILILLSVVCMFPFYWMVRSSFMTNREIMSLPIQWLPSHFNFDNFVKAFSITPFGRYFLNSIIVVSLKLKFRGKNFWFAVLLTTMMIPYSVLMIPQFVGWQKVGAYNTFWPLTLPAFFGNAFNIFLVRQFFSGIPKDYDAAAKVDGANYFDIYWKIILPCAKPVLCSVAVFTFMSTWNDFMGPLLYLDDDNLKTVSLGLQYFIGQHDSQWSLLMAASTCITLPMIVVYFFAQRYFIEGITFSGLKG